MTHNILIRTLTSPECLGSLAPADWDRLIPAARQAGVLGRLALLVAHNSLLDKVPYAARTHLHSAGVIAANEERVMRWELNRIGRALSEVDCEVVLLKGAAYVLAALPIARGRLSTDIDILVPKSRLSSVEHALLRHGWQPVKLQEYDQYFYRAWSHELPPLVHRERRTLIDVHHTILPPTGRLHPDPKKLLTAARLVEGTRFHVLAPPDMVLHSAAHSFQDGDFMRGLRDLVDINDLVRHFSQAGMRFWDRLVGRAEELDLARPLYYALRYANLYLQTPIPTNIIDRSRRWKPPWPACSAMDLIVDQAVTAGPWRKDLGLRLSRKLLYVRAHWLRMPPYLLIPHLIRKALRKRAATIEHRA